MLNTLKDIYMIDLVCDDSLMPFYEQFEMFKANGLMKRNFKGQNGVNGLQGALEKIEQQI